MATSNEIGKVISNYANFDDEGFSTYGLQGLVGQPTVINYLSHELAEKIAEVNPDIIAGNNQRMLALECKTLKKGKKYLNQEEIQQLTDFSRKFGAEPWLAMKFDRQPWSFIQPDHLEKTGNCLAISQNLLKNKGITFQELISKTKDLKD